MKSLSRSLVARSAVAVAAIAACGAASALPSFTFDPSAVGLNGTAFTADNLIVSDFATVTGTSTGFSETGILNFTSAQLGGSPNAGGGLGTTYGLYIAFTATGTTTSSIGGSTTGSVDSLTYSLMGYNSPTIVTPGATPAGAITLGTGSLSTGANFFQSFSVGSTVVAANLFATVSFMEDPTKTAFFVSPSPFYGMSQTSFNNYGQEITTTGNSFTVTNGGGSVNFLAAPVPEPETYALMLGGLAAVGFVARRRSNG